MKKITITLFITLFALFVSNSVDAQVFQVSVNPYNSVVFGDLTKKELHGTGAGYVDFAYGGGLEFKYYIKNLGLGAKWGYTHYVKDMDSYQSDLAEELGIIDAQFIMTSMDSYNSYSFSLVVSYVLKVSDKFQFEPYFSSGIKSFVSPFDHIIYSQNSTTYTYRKDLQAYVGFCFSPGLKLQWNISKHIGLNLFMEYEGVGLFEETEESINYSYNSFEVNSTKKSYNPQSLNVGLGFAYSFGKGLNK